MVPIEIRDVSLIYDTPGGKVPGVKDVSLNIGASEFVCIVGPSGCGKSTVLRCINRMHESIAGARVEGHVLLAEQDIYAPASNPKRCGVASAWCSSNPTH